MIIDVSQITQRFDHMSKLCQEYAISGIPILIKKLRRKEERHWHHWMDLHGLVSQHMTHTHGSGCNFNVYTRLTYFGDVLVLQSFRKADDLSYSHQSACKALFRYRGGVVGWLDDALLKQKFYNLAQNYRQGSQRI